MKILSFDPASFRNLGWCSVNASDKIESCNGGTFVTPNTDQPWQVLWHVFLFADNLISTEKPDIIIMEKTSSFAGGFVTGQVSNCMGVLLSLCTKHQKDVVFVFPTHVKKVVTGSGKATKVQIRKSVQSLVKKLSNIDVKFDADHAYDACANILTWFLERNNGQK